MERNIERDEHTGAWIVEYRDAGDRGWTRVYFGGCEKTALAKYKKMYGRGHTAIGCCEGCETPTSLQTDAGYFCAACQGIR